MAITPLPSPPSTSDPANFSTMADAFLAALATFVTQANALGTALFLVLQNYVTGLTLSTAGSSATFGIAAGQAANSTNAALMALASAYTKTTSAWALGSGVGALDTGAIAINTWYHVYLIQRSDTGVTDVLISTNASSPSMPTSYDYKRRIGSMKTNGSSQWILFSQNGNEFLWSVPTADTSGTIGAATAITLTLTVPTGVKVNGIGQIRTTYNAVDSNFLLTSFDQADTSPATQVDWGVTSNIKGAAPTFNVRTNTSAQIRFRGTDGSGNASDAAYAVTTHGWIDTRGQS